MHNKFTLILACLFLAASHSFAQCGTDPAPGTTSPTGTGVVVNTYYPSTASTSPGATSLTLGAVDARHATPIIAVGDLVLIIQMQGTDINSTNTNAYGDGVGGAPGSGYLTSDLYAGYYEYANISAVTGSVISFSAPLANTYYHQVFTSTTSIRRYQVIRVPRAYNLTINSGNSVTAPAWTSLTTGVGGTGGVVALDAANTMTINGSITVTGMGFRGGGGKTFAGATTGNSNGSGTLLNTDHRFNSAVTNNANLTGGAKGEGIAGTPAYRFSTGATTTVSGTLEGYLNGSMGWGAPANAGGGGTDGAPTGTTQNQYNSGGGGGANGGAGGKGGSGWHGGSGNAATYATGGYGGVAFIQRGTSRIVMGGGGGAGTANNSVAGDEYYCSGAAGGGIVIIRARTFTGNGSIAANGATAPGIPTGGRTDAAGGGGGGGTIVAITRTTVANGLGLITATANGGAGGNSPANYDHGPGGGGGGGVIIANGPFANPASTVTGGSNGFTTNNGGTTLVNAFGATAGTSGVIINLPTAPVFFSPTTGSTACGILPVRLESFNLSLNGSTTQLNWEVDQAVDFAGFDIEFSTDGFSFVSLGEIPYRNSQSKYEYIHAGNTAAVSYYRLKLKDKNGSAEYSKILTIRQNLANKSLTLYPQPAKGFTTVQVAAINRQQAQVQLFNTNGARVAQKLVQLGSGNNIFLFDNLGKLSSGFYTLRITVDGKVQQAKLIIDN